MQEKKKNNKKRNRKNKNKRKEREQGEETREGEREREAEKRKAPSGTHARREGPELFSARARRWLSSRRKRELVTWEFDGELR